MKYEIISLNFGIKYYRQDLIYYKRADKTQKFQKCRLQLKQVSLNICTVERKVNKPSYSYSIII